MNDRENERARDDRGERIEIEREIHNVHLLFAFTQDPPPPSHALSHTHSHKLKNIYITLVKKRKRE